MRVLLWLLRGIVLVAVIYLVGTGAYGALVGAQIHKAKTQSAALNFGAQLLGRDQVEGYVVRRYHMSPVLTDSPTFWIGLRYTE